MEERPKCCADQVGRSRLKSQRQIKPEEFGMGRHLLVKRQISQLEKQTGKILKVSSREIKSSHPYKAPNFPCCETFSHLDAVGVTRSAGYIRRSRSLHYLPGRPVQTTRIQQEGVCSPANKSTFRNMQKHSNQSRFDICSEQKTNRIWDE